ncbi:hypothetical protein [Zoogloea sp.]|uniref:hypothetical protein n=1 Tax=Zoogloea sp. TaxID=49181 RepID=UPI00258F8223|nr:hypothetical protein [Zoogloea sp.]MBT9496219.1 hypothetical protein [Zoogloea sp.]MDD2670159.1 hypothetical protein [Zoogloea sp.]
MEQQIRTLTARLLASRSLPRTDALVRRALVDEAFRVDLDARLAAVGLQLIDNPYAAHVAVALTTDVHEPVFGATREYAASNLGLTRDQLALLVVIWALIILPKRERQVNRQKLADDGQNDMFGKDAPLAYGEEVSGALSEASLLADFAPVIGHKTYVQGKLLSRLAQLGFIERKGGMILEGPLLDVLLDYRTLADRIIYGTLGEVLAQAGHPPPARDAFTAPEPDDADAEEDD